MTSFGWPTESSESSLFDLFTCSAICKRMLESSPLWISRLDSATVVVGNLQECTTNNSPPDNLLSSLFFTWNRGDA